MGANAFLHCLLNPEKVCFKLYLSDWDQRKTIFSTSARKKRLPNRILVAEQQASNISGTSHVFKKKQNGVVGIAQQQQQLSLFFLGGRMLFPQVTMPKIWTNAPGHIIHHPIVAPYQRLPPPTTEIPLKKRTIYDLRFPKSKIRSVATLFRPLWFFVMGNWGCFAPGREGSEHSTYS